MLRWISLILALVVPLAASAQVCPEGASTEVGYDQGTPLRLLAFHPDDAARANDVGVEGVVEGGLQNIGECWFQGDFTTTDGRALELSKVAVAPAKPVHSAACPEGAARGQIPNGSAVRIVGIHPDDAYYPNRPEFVGRRGFIDRGLDGVGCWRSGWVLLDDGLALYFYKGALAPDPEAPGNMWLGTVVPKDRRVDLLAIHATDRLYRERDSLIGKHCVATSAMYSIQNGWFTGPVRCDDGQELQFYKVAVSLPDALGVGDETTLRVGAQTEHEPPGGCPEGSEPSVFAGSRVRVIGLGPEDARAADAESFIGMEGVIAANEGSGACWVRGEITPDEGPSIYFRQVAIASLDAPCPAGGSRVIIDEGTWLELVGLHPDDGHADDAAAWVGTRFVADSEMWPVGCWYKGRVAGAGGADAYFLGASFRALSDACPPGALTDPPQPDDLVRILAVGPGDAYYELRGELKGVAGTFGARESRYGSCWMAGKFNGAASSYFFHRVAVAPSDAEPVPAPKLHTSTTLYARQHVVVLDIDVFDPTFPARDALRGTTCEAAGTLVRMERGWYSGKVSCDGTVYPFTKVLLGVP